MTKLENLIQQIKELSVGEKRSLNAVLVEMINHERSIEAQSASAKFQIGDIVAFTKSGRGRHAGTHYVKVMSFNRARTAIVGPECSRDGTELPFGSKWTVATTTCVKVK